MMPRVTIICVTYNRRDHVLKCLESCVRQNYPNLEDFLAQVEMARRFNSRKFVPSTLWPNVRLEQADQMLRRALAGYLWRFTAKATSASVKPVVDFCARILRPGDVVVTFNWDLTIERSNSLIDEGRGAYDLEYSYKQAGLHGSKRRCPFGGPA